MTAPRWSRRASLAWVAGCYLLAFAVAAVTLLFVPEDLDTFWTAAIADVAATFVVFAFSRGLKCSSMYDAYWSVAPIVIVFYWVFHAEERVHPIRAGAVLFLVTWWGMRLTYNWARSWPGLHHTDWRYEIMRDRAPKVWFFSDLMGIHLFPTVEVLARIERRLGGVVAGYQRPFVDRCCRTRRHRRRHHHRDGGRPATRCLRQDQEAGSRSSIQGSGPTRGTRTTSGSSPFGGGSTSSGSPRTRATYGPSPGLLR